MRILIADDEHLARITLQSMLSEIDSSIEIAEATNGKELMEKALSFFPHIVIVDIQMPLFNGLDAIKRMKDKLPLTKWVILTGFAQFDYAKEAVGLHVYNYLLKPVPLAQLREVVLQAKKDISHEIEAGNVAFEQQLLMFLKFPKSIQLVPTTFQVAVICTDGNMEGLSVAISQMLVEMKKTVSTHFEIFARGAVLPLDETSCCLIIGAQRKEIVEQLFVPTLRKILHAFSSSFWAIYDTVQGEADTIIPTLEACKKASSNGLFFPRGSCITVSSCKELPNAETLLAISQKLQQAVFDNRAGRLILAKTLVETAVTEALTLPKQNWKELYYFLSYLYSLIHSQYPLALNEASYQRITKDLDGFLHLQNNSFSPQVNDVVLYLENHYNEALSVKSIASLLGLSPNYLSTRFRQETGKRFVEYLSEVRINQAKLRLAHSQMHINEIATAVGILDVRYFSDLFKKYEGCMPSEYRERTAK